MGKSNAQPARYSIVEASSTPDDFVAFYEATKDRVYRAVLLATRQPDRAEDAVADAYADAYAKWAHVRQHPNPIALVTRSAINRFRSGWRIWQREVPEIPDVKAVAPPEVAMEEDLLGRLWRLPRRQREVVALRLLVDLDTAQTAALLGIAPKTVTVHLHRAVAALRLSLAGTEYEELA